MTCYMTNDLINKFARVFTDMEFDRKFQMATGCRSVTIGSFLPDHQYPIVHAERVNTRYVHSVLLVTLESSIPSVKLFLPKR